MSSRDSMKSSESNGASFMADPLRVDFVTAAQQASVSEKGVGAKPGKH